MRAGWLAGRVGAAVALSGTVVSVPAWLAVAYTARVEDWLVQTDELLYERLALSFVSTRSVIPQLHGEPVEIVSLLYPLLLAPFFALAPVPDALQGAHVFNAVAMSSAAVPAYLLARQLLPRAWSLAVGLLSVVIPWMALTGVLLTEAVGYPAFLWSVLGMQRALQLASWKRDLLALAGIALAYFTRTQFAVLFLAFPLAILIHEAYHAASLADRGARLRTAAKAIPVTARRHRVLVLVYVTAAAALVGVTAMWSLESVLGSYSVTVRGSILPSGIWQAAATHLDAVAIGCGLLPLLIGGSWVLATLVRSQVTSQHAFAALSLLLVLALSFETASYDLRFGGPELIRDRYLFYLVPLLLIATATALHGPVRPWLVGVLLAGFFAGTVRWLPFPTADGLTVDSPIRVLNDSIVRESGRLSTHTFVAVTGLLLGIVAMLAWRLLPRILFTALVFAALLAFNLLTTNALIRETVQMNSFSGRAFAEPVQGRLDWIDAALPEDATAALVPFPRSLHFGPSAIVWWDAEYWNRAATFAFVDDSGLFSYTPFPVRRLRFDWQTGTASGTENAAPYVVSDRRDPRFRLIGKRKSSRLSLDLIDVARPYRALWITKGLDADGWSRPGRTATLRVYSQDRARAMNHRVAILIRAAPGSPARYRLATETAVVEGIVQPGAPVLERSTHCVPPGSFTDITLTSWSEATINDVWPNEGKRGIGAHYGPIWVRSISSACGADIAR